MNPARSLLAACLMAAAVGIVAAPAGAAPAAAPCRGLTAAQAAEDADAVFTGEVTAVSRRTGSPQDVVFAHEVRVELFYKGSITSETVPVLTRPANRRSTGLGPLERGESYLFFVRAAAESFVAGGCSGTGLAAPDHVTRIEQLLGDGKSPLPPEVPQATLTQVDASEPADLTRTAAPGLALVLIGLLGLVVVRRLGRRV